MTRDDLVAALRDLLDRQDDDPNYDRRNEHVRADDCLLRYINDPEVTELWSQLEFWYA